MKNFPPKAILAWINWRKGLGQSPGTILGATKHLALWSGVLVDKSTEKENLVHEWGSRYSYDGTYTIVGWDERGDRGIYDPLYIDPESGYSVTE